MNETLLETLANFQRQGSNWRFRSVLSLDLHTVKYGPLRGSSYIPLPDFLEGKKAIINCRNEDDEYFKWAITRALNPVEKTLSILIENFDKIRGSHLGVSEVSNQFD